MDKTFEKIYEEYNKESALGENQALFEKVYAEAEMLNEMNPKLKALLAAGLIGTAGLGMQSCSNPSDSVYYPYTVEAPSTDNPGSGGAETSNPSGGDRGETVEENKVNFEDLGVTNKTDQRRIAKAGKLNLLTNEPISSLSPDYFKGFSVFVYIKDSNPVFQKIEGSIPKNLPSDYSNGAYYYECVDDGCIYNYIIPADEKLENSFGHAIDAYNKASQSNQ